MERALLRNGNVASADDWRSALEPVIERYRDVDKRRLFRGDVAFAIPELDDPIDAEVYEYVIRLKANQVLERHLGHLLTRPVGRPPKRPQRVYQAKSVVDFYNDRGTGRAVDQGGQARDPLDASELPWLRRQPGAAAAACAGVQPATSCVGWRCRRV